MSDATDTRLAALYEALPYPARDPREEAKRLIIGSPGHLREVEYWLFGGRWPEHGLRALFAGGGTGDGAIMLAQQLATENRPGSVTWLDRSAASLRIARARADARHLTLQWEQRSLLDLPRSGLGPFDYVDCCGVLHHLPDPAEGLRALTSVLAPGGGLGLMVYAPHGRTGVYMLQDALRLLAPPDDPLPARVDLAKRMLKHLPSTAWLMSNPSVRDHMTGGDAGIADLLLNPRDQAFTVPALTALLVEAGLEPVCWVEPVRYDPARLMPDPRLRAPIEHLNATERAALAESLAGNMGVHIVYCVRKGEAPTRPDPLDPHAIPVTRDGTGTDLTTPIAADNTLTMVIDGLRLVQPMPPLARGILTQIDGTRTVADIETVFASRGIPADVFRRAWRETFTALEQQNRLFLRHPNTPAPDRPASAEAAPPPTPAHSRRTHPGSAENTYRDHPPPCAG